jgi:uridine monophosphate synthetase
MSFFEKLTNAIYRNQSLLVIALDPNPEMMPNFATEAEQEDWLKQIIEQTSDLVCAYKPNLGFYQALGSQGLSLLSEILSYIPAHIPIILDAKYGDLNSSSIFAEAIFNKWQVDAVTITPYAGQDQVTPFLVYPERGVFILCHTSNPGALSLQEYPTADNPFFLQVIREAQTWGSPQQLFLEVGTTNPEIITKIRKIAPERWILLRSIWSQKNNLKQLLQAGLNSNQDGILVPVPQDILKTDDLVSRLNVLRDEVNIVRNQAPEQDYTCEIWTANICLLNHHPHQNLILQLYDIGCLLFGDYVQASGATFSYYIDLRKIISNPQIFHQVLQAYAEILKTLKFDRIAGLPYGALPTATGLSLLLNYPMIFPRKEVKAHGTRKLIEGHFNEGELVVVVDDILISGNSAIEGAQKLESARLRVQDIVVFIDHEEGVKDRVKAAGYNAYSVLTISEITRTLYEAGRIDKRQYKSIVEKK